jgi:hypothetical protein
MYTTKLKNCSRFFKNIFNPHVYIRKIFQSCSGFFTKSYFSCKKAVDLEWTPVATLKQEQEMFSGKGSGETYEDPGSQQKI